MSSDSNDSSTEWSDDEPVDNADYENVRPDGDGSNDVANGDRPGDTTDGVGGDISGNDREEADLSDAEPSDNGAVAPLVVGLDDSNDGSDVDRSGVNIDGVEGDTSSNDRESADYENVFPGADSADSVGDGKTPDGTGNGNDNAETGPSSGTQEGITTPEHPTTEDPEKAPCGGTGEGKISPDIVTENEAQSDGNCYVAQANIAPTIVSVEPPPASPTPPDAGDVVEKSTTLGTSIQVPSFNSRNDIGHSSGGDPYTSGGKVGAIHTAPPSVEDTTGRNVIMIPVNDNDKCIPSENASASGSSNGVPRDGFSAYYSKTAAATARADRGFVIVVPVGSTPSSKTPDVISGTPSVPSGTPNFPTSGKLKVSASGVVVPDIDDGRSMVYNPDKVSHITSNGTGTIIRIGGGVGVTANGHVVSAPQKPLPQNGVTVLSVGLPETQHATSNGDAAIVTIDVNRQPGKVGISFHTRMCPTLH